MYTKRLLRIDSFFDVVADHLEFSLISPKNQTKARAHFFKDSETNPHFTYGKPDPHLQGIRDILEELSFGNEPLEQLFEQKRKELILKTDLLLHIGTPQFSKISRQLYTPPNEKLIEQAYAILKLPPAKSTKRVLRKEVLCFFRKTIQEYGIKYRIKSIDMPASAQINAKRRLLELKKRERFAFDYVQRLAIHELGTHALRTENGLLQPLKIFKNGFAHYLETEEGLAAYNEYRTGLMTSTILRNYAGRIIAIHYALKYDFITTYHHLTAFFPKKMAWKLTLRAKRGLKDTSKPGAYTKDCTYLRGFIEILKYSKNQDIDALYVGKIGIKDLPLLAEVTGIKPPKYLLNSLLEKKCITSSERRIDDELLHSILQIPYEVIKQEEPEISPAEQTTQTTIHVFLQESATDFALSKQETVLQEPAPALALSKQEDSIQELLPDFMSNETDAVLQETPELQPPKDN
jgi:uncharacterized protein (TIGR02421 family)